jgi:hypothetical protein
MRALDPDPNFCIDPSAHHAVILAGSRSTGQYAFLARFHSNAVKKSEDRNGWDC